MRIMNLDKAFVNRHALLLYENNALIIISDNCFQSDLCTVHCSLYTCNSVALKNRVYILTCINKFPSLIAD